MARLPQTWLLSPTKPGTLLQSSALQTGTPSPFCREKPPNWNSISPQTENIKRPWGAPRGIYQNAGGCHSTPDALLPILQYLVFLWMEGQAGTDKRIKSCPQGIRDLGSCKGQPLSLPFSAIAWSSTVESQGRVWSGSPMAGGLWPQRIPSILRSPKGGWHC